LIFVATKSYIADVVKAVGIRELKNRLSEYLRLVRSGEDILVTDRGQVVAELRPPGQSPVTCKYPGLSELVRQGRARLGAPNDPTLYPPLKKLLGQAEIAQLLDEERGQR
jgi:antitoxin (DNA-binding transcriptional repressor) of toxin-antitoxin stability system